MKNLKAELTQLRDEARRAIEGAGTLEVLEEVRRAYLGRRGRLAALFRTLADADPSERPALGETLNEIREDLERALARQSESIAKGAVEERLGRERIDVTLPGRPVALGRSHILRRTIEEVQQIFMRMGFEVVDGTEVETEEFNFERLNTPRDHPARDAQDTFYITDELLLRTQGTAVDPRVMLQRRPPMRILTTGRCYRRDASDPTHAPVFHQVDGFMVGEGITFADLKGVLAAFARQLFGPETRTRFLPDYFPFTEPSAQVAVTFRGGWLEMGGCGMFHPRVLEFAGIDPERYTAFAFGWGVDRPAMVRYGIPDIRLFWENDLRMLEQF